MAPRLKEQYDTEIKDQLKQDLGLDNVMQVPRLQKIVVLTQYLSHSLDRHLAQTWRLSPLLGYYVVTVPAQMRRGPHWFEGSADAIYQNLNLIHDERPDIVCVFGADHIYRMDPRQMVEQHLENGAGVTVAGIRVRRDESDQFGVIQPSDSVAGINRFCQGLATNAVAADHFDINVVAAGSFILEQQRRLRREPVRQHQVQTAIAIKVTLIQYIEVYPGFLFTCL